ncbi:MAG: DUF1194 domain-containing protein [Alphaproteobacteria bacterium]|nr:DUF1194 domain-containing protein [Alphaproteobacteria bacterium]
MDAVEHDLQMDGYARAMTSPEVLKAIRSGPVGAVAVTLFEWSGPSEQRVMVEWMTVRDGASAERFADILRKAGRVYFDGTSISGAINFAMRRLADNPHDGTRRVIDVSADGANNRGRPAHAARDDALAAGVTINGLAIINDRPSRWPGPEPPLDQHFRDEVIGGPGAFLIVVKGFETFAEAIRNKLIREIVEAEPDPSPARRKAAASTE